MKLVPWKRNPKLKTGRSLKKTEIGFWKKYLNWKKLIFENHIKFDFRTELVSWKSDHWIETSSFLKKNGIGFYENDFELKYLVFEKGNLGLVQNFLSKPIFAVYVFEQLFKNPDWNWILLKPNTKTDFVIIENYFDLTWIQN